MSKSWLHLVLFGLEKCGAITIELDIFLAKKVALHIFFLIIMQKLKLSLVIVLPLEKTLLKSFFKKN